MQKSSLRTISFQPLIRHVSDFFHNYLTFLPKIFFFPSPSYLYIQNTCSAGPHDIICVLGSVLFLCSNSLSSFFSIVKSFLCWFFLQGFISSICLFEPIYFQCIFLPDSVHIFVWSMFCANLIHTFFFCFRFSMKQLSSDTGVEMNLTVGVFLFSQCLEWPITFWGIRRTIISLMLGF